MLRIYDVILDVVRALRPELERVRQHDPDLARQLRRALTSVPLNVAEAASSRGANRAARHHTAAGSMREVIAGFEVAEALGYVGRLDPVVRDRMGLVVGTLMKNALRR
jgi:four helix bundle protein